MRPVPYAFQSGIYLHILIFLYQLSTADTPKRAILAMQNNRRVVTFGVQVWINTGNRLSGANGPVSSFIAIYAIAFLTMLGLPVKISEH